jgi:hypothetical protein
MNQKNKSFDCVDMKNKIQAELFSEYLKRKSEFPNYADFINATAATDPVIIKFRKGLLKKKPLILTKRFARESKVV